MSFTGNLHCSHQINCIIGHCELNPIELVLKGFLKKNNKSFRLADLEKLVPEASDTVTLDILANCCEQAIKEENKFSESDGLQEEAVNEFLIEFGDSDQEDDDLGSCRGRKTSLS